MYSWNVHDLNLINEGYDDNDDDDDDDDDEISLYAM